MNSYQSWVNEQLSELGGVNGLTVTLSFAFHGDTYNGKNSDKTLAFSVFLKLFFYMKEF